MIAFVRALCMGDHVGDAKIGKGSKIMSIVNEKSQPLSAIETSANSYEITFCIGYLGGSDRMQCAESIGVRWAVENFFSWMKPDRKLLNRFEKKTIRLPSFLGPFHHLHSYQRPLTAAHGRFMRQVLNLALKQSV